MPGILPHGSTFRQLCKAKILLGKLIVLSRFPEDLAKNAQGEFCISCGEVQPSDEAADFFLGWSGRRSLPGAAGTRFQIAAGAKGIDQECGEALEIGGGGGGMFLRFRGNMRSAREFVKADGYGLAKVHGAVLFAGGNAHEPVAVAEIFI